MEILSIAIVVVLCIVVGIAAYKYGCKKTVTIEKINNDKLKQEQNQLIQENKRIKEDIAGSQKIIQQVYDMKADAVKDAEEAYEQTTIALNKELENRKALLEKQYQDKKEILDNQYQTRKKDFEKELEIQKSLMYNDFEEYKLKIKLESESLEQDLLQLRKARNATIEANKRTDAVQEDKDNYRLMINAADANDIKTIETIRHLLVNPRILSMLIWQTYWQPLAKKIFPIILGQDKVCGIYKITNTETQECYIGQAIDCRKRWLDHCKYGLGIDTPAKNKLYKAMQQYGLDKFTFELLEECDQTELNDREKYYIDMFNSVDFGYNATVGNNG